jgi:hypothetical protein
MSPDTLFQVLYVAMGKDPGDCLLRLANSYNLTKMMMRELKKGYIVDDKVIPVDVIKEKENSFSVMLPDGQEKEVPKVYFHLQDAFDRYKAEQIAAGLW